MPAEGVPPVPTTMPAFWLSVNEEFETTSDEWPVPITSPYP